MNLKLSTRLAVVALGGLLATNALAQNLITNPGFETPSEGSSYANFNPGSTGITGWTVDTSPGDGVSLFSAAGASGFSIANNGTQILQLCGVSYTTGGGVHQTIATTPGQLYSISIAVSYRSGAVTTGNFSFGGQNHNLSASTTSYVTNTWTVTATSSSTVVDITGSTSSGANQLLIDNVSVTAVTDPGISVGPVSQRVMQGQSPTFSVTASGLTTLGYQWQATNNATGFTNIPSATASTLTLSGVQSTAAPAYRVVVTDTAGSITSSVANLTVDTYALVDVDIGSAATQSGAALLGATGDTWNGVASATSPLVNSANNTLTGVGFTLSGNSGINDNTVGVATYDPNTANLMRDCAYGAPNTTFTTGLNGLTEYNGSPFELVVYAAIGDANQGSSLSLAGATGGNTGSTLVTTGVSRSITNVPPGGIGVAYQTFTGTINTSALTITASQPSTYHGVNGFQLLVLSSDPVAISQPTNQTSAVGLNPTFSVSALGLTALSYQWQTNGGSGFANVGNGSVGSATIAGATNATLTITNVNFYLAGLTYRVIVTDTAGSVTSSVATLTLVDPIITTQPTSQSAWVGSSASFSVTAGGATSFGYQWQATNNATGFTNIPSATGSTLTFTGVTTNQALSYRVVATDTAGSITSSVASLSVISSVLVDVDVGTGSGNQSGAALLGASGDTWNSISASGTTSPLVNSANSSLSGVGFNITGGTGFNNNGNANMDPNTTALMGDDYYVASGSFTCGYNGLGSYANYPFTLVVYSAIGDPNQGGKLNLAGAAGGNTASQLTTTGASRSITNVVAGGGIGVSYNTFTGTITNSSLIVTIANNLTSFSCVNGMQLLIQDPYLLIASQPVSVTNASGSTVNFSVSATGAALSYQWQATNNSTGFTNIPGATSSTLTLTGATSSSPVNYQVVVSNSFSGSVTSSVATLSLTPHISTQPPAVQAVLTGNNATISVVADGSPTVTYQWQATNNLNGFTNVTDVGAFTGSATSTLNITSAQAAQSLTYRVVVANGFGSVTSTPSVLAVGSSPVITLQPLSQTNNAGTTVNFTVTATGSAPLAYQWQATNNTTGFTNIPAATSSTLTLASIADANALTYQVIITNSSGAVTSSPATLTVIDPPAITVQPASTSVTLNGTVNFNVTATGTAPLNYQWQTNGVSVGNNAIVSGATSNPLTLTGVTTNYALNYTVVVSNPAGSVTSSPAATLTVHVPPSIVTQPSSPVVSPGATATFSVATAGDPTLAYQWQSGPAGGPFTNLTDNGQISGSTTGTLTITNANTPVAISYQVVVTNNYGSVTSTVASLTLGKLIDVDVGQAATQSGAALLGASSDVTWNNFTGSALSNITDSKGNTLTGVGFNVGNILAFGSDTTSSEMDPGTVNLMEDYAFGYPGALTGSVSGLGAYQGFAFKLVVYAAGNSYGGAQAATVSVTSGSSGTTPSSGTVTSASRRISDGVGVAYQTFTGTLNASTLAFSVAEASSSGINLDGIQLLIYLPDPAITNQPVSQTKVAGSTATFSVGATGSATLSYQWQATNSASGGFTNISDVPSLITGSQSNILTFTGVTANEALTYQVVVSNGSGSVTSTPASLNVLTIPIITTNPASQTVLNGSTVTFTVGATGIGTLSYQWQTNGVNVTDGGIISGSATSTLTLAGVTTNNAISYQVVVTNVNGSVTSSPASLTVLPTTELIDVDIGTGSGTQTGAAILGQSGDVWNVVSQGTITTVVDSGSNTLSGVTIGDSAAGSYATPSPAVDAATAALMSDFNYNTPGSGPVPVTITGLGVYTNSAFTLVAYAGMDPGQACTINITTGATGGNTAGTLATTSATRKLSDGIGVAYNEFTGTLTNGTLTFTVSGASFHGPNGFQLLLSPTVPPVITTNPVASTTNYTGTTATFSVGAVTATGSLTYQWQANGTNLTDGGIVSGSATSTLTLTGVTTNSALPYQVIVSNGSGSVTSRVANLTVFTVPVAGTNFTLGVTLGVPSTVKIIGGKYTPTDANGFPLSITSVTGATNGTVSTDGTNITYTATNTAVGATNDSFNYTVSDGYSGTATQTVSVTIDTSSAAAQGFNKIGTPQLIGGYEVMTYAGIPGFNYALDWTTNLTPPIVWTPIMTNPASANGSIILSNTPSGGSDFYRTRYVP